MTSDKVHLSQLRIRSKRPIDIRNSDLLSAFGAGVHIHSRIPRKHAYLSTVGAHLCAKVEGEFHFGERLLQGGGRYSANHGAAFIAHDVGLISANNAVQTAATVGLSKIGMRERCPYDVLRVHTLSVAGPPSKIAQGYPGNAQRTQSGPAGALSALGSEKPGKALQ